MELVQENNPIIDIVPGCGPAPRPAPCGFLPKMSFKNAVGRCISKYATFQGRARRREYWWFVLFTLLLTLLPIAPVYILSTLDEMSVIDMESGLSPVLMLLFVILAALGMLACFVLLIPCLAVQTRRLHDIGRSGWWVVASLLVSVACSAVPFFIFGGQAMDMGEIEQFRQAFQVSGFAGCAMLAFEVADLSLALVLLLFSLRDSDKGENKYGPSPKYVVL